MWGYHPVPARREFAILNTFVKQGKTIFQIPVLLLFSLLFTPEMQAMPRKPNLTAETKPRQSPPRIKINGEMIELKAGRKFDYQPDMVFMGPASKGPITWFYGYSRNSSKRPSDLIKAIPAAPPIFPLDDFRHEDWGKVGYHYFAYKFQNNLSGFSLRFIEIRVKERLDTVMIPENPPPLPSGNPGEEEETPYAGEEVPLRVKLHTPQTPHGGTKAYYRIENPEPGILIEPPPSGYDELGWFKNDLDVRLTFPTPGLKIIHIKYENQISTHEKMARAIVIPLVIPLNANDSNGNHKPDCKDEPFPLQPLLVDPELMHKSLFFGGLITYNPPWELEKNDFFEKYAGYKLRLSTTPGIKLWRTQYRNVPSDTQWEISPQNRDSILNWLSTEIYVEGIQPSTEDGQENIKLELFDPFENRVTYLTWILTVLHLYVNHDKNEKALELSDKNPPVNQIVNPPVITIDPSMEENDTNICSWFEVDSSNLDLLKKYKDLIEWRVEGQTPETNPIIVNTPELSPDGRWLTRGLKMGVLGRTPTTARIGIRLTGMAADYISFRKEVVDICRIPIAFHFFTETESPLYLNNVKLIKARMETLLPSMNMIGRQAGIEFEFKKATPEDQIASYIDDLSWEVEKTVSSQDSIKFYFKNTPGILPDPFPKNLHIILRGLDENKNTVYRGAISKASGNTATALTEYISIPYLPIWGDDKKYTLHPDFIMQARDGNGNEALPLRETYQTLIHSDSFVHSGIQSWAVSSYGAIYSSAIASTPDVVNLNFVNNLTRRMRGDSKLSGAVSPYHTPTHSFLSEEKDNITMTTYFEYSPIPKMGNKNIKATLFSFSTLPNTMPNQSKGLSKVFTHNILQTLGLKTLGITGDLSHYNDPHQKNAALRENILIQRNHLLMINPISPCTDHAALPPVYKTRNLMQDNNAFIYSSKEPESYLRYKLNAAQARIVHDHFTSDPVQ